MTRAASAQRVPMATHEVPAAASNFQAQQHPPLSDATSADRIHPFHRIPTTRTTHHSQDTQSPRAPSCPTAPASLQGNSLTTMPSTAAHPKHRPRCANTAPATFEAIQACFLVEPAWCEIKHNSDPICAVRLLQAPKIADRAIIRTSLPPTHRLCDAVESIASDRAPTASRCSCRKANQLNSPTDRKYAGPRLGTMMAPIPSLCGVSKVSAKAKPEGLVATLPLMVPAEIRPA